MDTAAEGTVEVVDIVEGEAGGQARRGAQLVRIALVLLVAVAAARPARPAKHTVPLPASPMALPRRLRPLSHLVRRMEHLSQARLRP